MLKTSNELQLHRFSKTTTTLTCEIMSGAYVKLAFGCLKELYINIATCHGNPSLISEDTASFTEIGEIQLH